MSNEASSLLINFLIIGLPECVALTTLLLALLKKEFHLVYIFQTAFLLASTVLIIRMIVDSMNLPGIHSAFAILVLALLVSYYWKVPKLTSLTLSAIIMLLVGFLEFIIMSLFNLILSDSVVNSPENWLFWLSFNWIRIIILTSGIALITRSSWYRQGVKFNSSHTG